MICLQPGKASVIGGDDPPRLSCGRRCTRCWSIWHRR